jgi:glycosyltransferase involved in cell wall biosynthesis
MNSGENPLITIIIAVFNGENTLQQCIDSVAHQTYSNKQLIIIDGGSTDGTVAIIQKNEIAINYWISEPDKGVFNAWNKGLAEATGEWICFLGADDYFWNAFVLEKMSESLKHLPADIRVAYGQVMLLGEGGQELYLAGKPWQEAKKSFRQYMSIPHQGVMHQSSLFKKHGNFDESFRITGDYELLLRELKSGNAEFFPELIIAGMRQGGISSHPENSLLLLREARWAHCKHVSPIPSINWLMALCRVYIRIVLWQVIGEKNARKTLDMGRRIMGLPPHWTRTE